VKINHFVWGVPWLCLRALVYVPDGSVDKLYHHQQVTVCALRKKMPRGSYQKQTVLSTFLYEYLIINDDRHDIIVYSLQVSYNPKMIKRLQVPPVPPKNMFASLQAGLWCFHYHEPSDWVGDVQWLATINK
jgi:hypothetical protein